MTYHGRKVLSCFSGGGGSSMGYKLAGYDVVGGVEIDGRMADCYERNLKPRFLFRGDIRDLVTAEGLPEELFGLDVLDGSPPCTSFSTAGKRERDWGKEKKFREGQKCQVLDMLFFDFIALAGRLRPKVVVAENVMGLLRGNAKKYVARILRDFVFVGYNVHFRVLKSERMGVPQARERVFFFALRDDLCMGLEMSSGLVDRHPELDIRFGELPIAFREIEGLVSPEEPKALTPCFLPYVDFVKPGCKFGDVVPKGSYFNHRKIHRDLPLPTIAGCSERHLIHCDGKRFLGATELMLGSSWPLDYDFGGSNVGYICGMSVPPVMMAQVALRMKELWLDKINRDKGTMQLVK